MNLFSCVIEDPVLLPEEHVGLSVALLVTEFLDVPKLWYEYQTNSLTEEQARKTIMNLPTFKTYRYVTMEWFHAWRPTYIFRMWRNAEAAFNVGCQGSNHIFRFLKPAIDR